ncbi:hypothetical protein ACWCP6_29390 [Streptomyces sp. NPDC002004]
MDALAAAGSAGEAGFWAYVVVLAGTAAGYMGVPLIGTLALTSAAVFASQGRLNIAAVLIVAAIGNEIGGVLGYKIGNRWGHQILERPGPALAWRTKAVTKGEALYRKWGRAAVFFTPSLVSGTLRMEFRQFVVWNFFAGLAFVLSVAPAAYGAGRVSTGHHDWASVGMLIGGLAVCALLGWLAVRYRRRHKARGTPEAPPEAEGDQDTADAPAESTVMPADSAVAPSEPSVTPADSAVTPAEPAVTPAESTAAPAEPGDAHAAGATLDAAVERQGDVVGPGPGPTPGTSFTRDRSTP